jgi:hypothetical protein
MSARRRRRRPSHGPSSPALREEPGCSGKVRYRDVGEAFSYGRLSAGVLYSAEILRAYECASCDRWHLTKETEVPWFVQPEEVAVAVPTPNMLTVAFTIPAGFAPEDLSPALALARRAAAEVFGHGDLRSHVSFPHRKEGGVDVALVSIHPAPIATAPDAEEEP